MRTQHFHCCGPRFNPWLGELRPHKPQVIAKPHLQSFGCSRPGDGRKKLPPRSSQVMLILLIWGPHLEQMSQCLSETENLSFLLHVWSFLLSCLWFGSDQIPNTEVPHGSTLSSLCLLFITFQGFKNYLYANSCHVYTSCLDLLQCFFFICPNLLSWQIHMDVAQMSLT